MDAVISNRDGSNSFSYHFSGQIGFKDGRLNTAFEQARQAMSSVLVGQRVTVPSVFAYGGYYAVELVPANGLFQVDPHSIRPAGQ